MPTIGYNYNIIQPRYEPNLLNVDLIAKVLMAKQAQYDTSFQSIQKLRRDALGIRFINKGEQAKIDRFNDKISQTFEADNGELGDLSDPKGAQKYISLFDEIGSNPQLISKFRKDQEYQDEIRSVEGKRASKDPTKAGFGAINYDNFMARVREYADLDLDSADAQGHVLRPYTDYVDTDKEIAERMKSVPIKKFNQQRTENGYIVTDSYEGRDPNDVARETQEYMKTRGAAQAREDAEYAFRRAKGDPRFEQAIYNDHVDYNIRQQREISSRLESLDGELNNTKDPEKIQALAGEKAHLEDALSQSKLTLKSPTDYFSREYGEIINDMTTVTLQDKIKNYAAIHGGYAKTTKVEPDRTYLEFKKMGMRVAEFNQNLKFKYDALAQQEEIAKDKLSLAAKKAATPTGQTDIRSAAMQGMSYISSSDSEHIDFASVYDSAKGSLEKLYAQQTNFLKEGLTHGNNKFSGENAGLELLIKPDRLDNDQFYGGSPYLRAWKVALDEQAVKRPDLYDFIGTRPKDGESWNKLKELNKLVTERVNQMMTQPKNREEAQYINHLQDIQANKTSMEDFMRKANESGDPAKFILENKQVRTYGNAVYDFNLPPGADKDVKEKAAEQLSSFRPSFDENLNTPYSAFNKESSQVNEGEYNKVFADPNRARTIPLDEVGQVKVSENGKVRIYFKPEAFQEYQTKDEKGDPIPDVKRSGVLSNENKYFSVKEGNTYKTYKSKDIQAKGYLEYVDPKLNRFNWSNQLGLAVSAKPQTRWDVSSDGQPVSFQIRKSTITGNIELALNGSEFVDTKTANTEQVINYARNLISQKSIEEIGSLPKL